MNDFQIKNILKCVFWVVFSSAASFLVFWFLLPCFNSDDSTSRIVGLSLFIVIFMFSGLLNYPFKLKKAIQVELLRKQCSYVRYFAWDYLLVSSVIIITSRLNHDFLTPIQFCLVATPPVIVWSVVAYSFMFKRTKADDDWSFAPGAVGLSNDRYAYHPLAKQVCNGLLASGGESVNVIALYGGFGQGKSSLARMIIESLDQNEILYTYISLTETNQEKEFSKLFAERFVETLAKRYPVIDTATISTISENILRETEYGILGQILMAISKINIGLLSTAQAACENNNDKGHEVNESVASIFGHIPKIKEKLWIINIDEIDRAHLGEVYRVIEVIERFKHLGQHGLPIRIAILMCVSREELMNNLSVFETVDIHAKLIKQFFEGGKNFTNVIFLPKVSSMNKKQIIYEYIRKRENNDDALVGFQALQNEYVDEYGVNYPNHRQSIAYMLSIVSHGSPREISRIIEAHKFTEACYESSVVPFREIRLADTLIMEFVRLRFKYLIDVYLKIINDRFVFESINDAVKKHFQEKAKRDGEIKDILKGIIEEYAGIKISDNEMKLIYLITKTVAHFVIDEMERTAGDYESRDLIYHNTLSEPHTMKAYLEYGLGYDGDETTRLVIKYYERLKAGEYIFAEMNNGLLMAHARFLSHAGGVDILVVEKTIDEIHDRIVGGKFKVDEVQEFESEHLQAIYYYCVLFSKLLFCAKRGAVESIVNKYLDKTAVVVKCGHLPTDAKYSLIDLSFSDKNNSDRMINNMRFKLYENNARKEKIREIVRHVFSEAKERYFDADSKGILYEFESAPMYVLYQSWSGNSQDIKEITTLRRAAERGMVNNREVIQKYWEEYDGTDIGDSLRRGVVSREVFLPVERLIDITKASNIEDQEIIKKMVLWESAINDPSYAGVFKVKDTANTIKYRFLSMIENATTSNKGISDQDSVQGLPKNGEESIHPGNLGHEIGGHNT